MSIVHAVVTLLMAILAAAAISGWHNTRKRCDRMSADRRILRHALRNIISHSCENDPYTAKTCKNALEETDEIK